MEINNKVRYSIFYRFIARSNILSMQNSYDETHTRSNANFGENSPTLSNDKEEAKEKTTYGEDNFKYDLPDFPLTQAHLTDY
jgi:hypothetical protein